MVWPGPTAVTLPFWSTVATFLLLLSQVMVLTGALAGETVARRVTVPSAGMLCFSLSSVTLSAKVELSSTTVMAQVLEMVLLELFTRNVAVAVMVALPTLTAVTLPYWSTVATLGLLEVQAMAAPALPCPEAVAVSRVSLGPESRFRVALMGVRSRAEGASSTVTRQVPNTLVPSVAVAVMVVVPGPTRVTTPFWSTVATFSLLLVHSSFLLVA